MRIVPWKMKETRDGTDDTVLKSILRLGVMTLLIDSRIHDLFAHRYDFRVCATRLAFPL